MKTYIKLIAKYSQIGAREFPEDTWSVQKDIINERDLFMFMKEMYKASARSFNNYPFNGLFGIDSISFKKQEVIENGGKFFYGEKIKCEAPVFLNSSIIKFKEYESAIKTRLPKLRKVQENRILEFNERNQYEALKSKYKNEP